MSIVWSHNEWDPLEEVIVGSVDGGMVPLWDFIDDAAHSKEAYAEAFADQGKPFPAEDFTAAAEEMASFVRILEAEGVRVRRPAPLPHHRPYATPSWEWGNGYNHSNPRDMLIVFGGEIIEAPTPRRGRMYEVLGYRPLLREYFEAGAKWTAAPRPNIDDDLYDRRVAPPAADEPLVLADGMSLKYPLTDVEPCFEAADFMRCGRDIFYHRSYVTNAAGVQWLQRHLGPEYRFHEIATRCRRPMHIDTTFVPLAPGKALVNPQFAPKLPAVLKKWDILFSPPPVPRSDYDSPYRMSSNWLSMNVFSLDAERVFVDSLQVELIAKLKDWGMRPIPLPYQRVYPFGGGLHCTTLDVRRRGTLESYF